MSRKILLMAFVLSAMLGTQLITIAVASPEWTVERITYGFLPSLIIDDQGRPHISYYDGDYLGYATRTNDEWQIEDVDNRAPHIGQYSSIALDKNGNPHISYIDFHHYDPDEHCVMCASYIGGSWALEEVDRVGLLTRRTTLAIKADGSPVIAYYDSFDRDLKYASKSGIFWVKETIDSAGDVGEGASLVLDSQDYPRVSYYDRSNGNLKYARWDGSSWIIEIVDSCAHGAWGYYISMDLDSNDNPHIAYRNSAGGLNYAKSNGILWSIETVGVDLVSFLSLTLDSNDNPHIGYGTDFSGEVRYAVKENNTWKIETVSRDMGNSGLSLALNPNNDEPAIVYAGSINYGDLNYACMPAEAIWVDPKYPTWLDLGDTFVVDVLINITDPSGPATGLWSFEYKLKWDSTGLEVKSIQYHSPWIRYYEVRNETGSGLPRAPEGFDYHWLALLAFSPSSAFVGVTSLCTYTFRALSYGNYTLDIYDDTLVDDIATLIPHTTVDGYARANICVIRADGSVLPPTAPISSVDNITYTLKGNISKSIVVERDNIVVDGAGYTVKGTVAGARMHGFKLSSVDNVTIQNTNIKNFTYGVYLYQSSNNTVSGNTIANNTYSGVYLYYSSNNTVSGNTITNNSRGVYLWYYSYNNAVSGNIITDNDYDGVDIYHFSNNNTISGNTIANNHDNGVLLYLSSNDNAVSGNNITNNPCGVYLNSSSYNTVAGNDITDNTWGVYLSWSSDNKFYHNNLIDNTQQVRFYYSGYANFWDDGYPSGGNYWSNYTGVDLYSGPFQNERGIDGIGDAPHVIDANNKDNYPFMNKDWWVDKRFIFPAPGMKDNVTVETDAILTHVVATKNTLHFKVTGPSGQTVYVNVTVPVGLNETAIKVFVNEVELEPPPFPIITSNGTHYFIYFELSLSTHDIIIRYGLPGDWLTYLIIGLLILLAVAVSTAVYVKKRRRRTRIIS